MSAATSQLFSKQAARRLVTKARIKTLYDAPESFTDLLPWAEYLPAHQAFLLSDGLSAGALFELQPVATDGQSAEYLTALAGQLQDLVTEAIPEEDPDPWVLQLFVQDEPSFRGFVRELSAEIDPRMKESPFTAHYLQTLGAHLTRVTAPCSSPPARSLESTPKAPSSERTFRRYCASSRRLWRSRFL